MTPSRKNVKAPTMITLQDKVTLKWDGMTRNYCVGILKYPVIAKP